MFDGYFNHMIAVKKRLKVSLVLATLRVQVVTKTNGHVVVSVFSQIVLGTVGQIGYRRLRVVTDERVATHTHHVETVLVSYAHYCSAVYFGSVFVGFGASGSELRPY